MGGGELEKVQANVIRMLTEKKKEKRKKKLSLAPRTRGSRRKWHCVGPGLGRTSKEEGRRGPVGLEGNACIQPFMTLPKHEA